MQKFVTYFICLVCLTVTGCANRKIEPMLGSMTHISQAITAFGSPVSVLKTSDTQSVYIWNTYKVYSERRAYYDDYYDNGYSRVSTGIGTGMGSHRRGTFGGVLISFSPDSFGARQECDLRITANNKTGNIEKFDYSGNTCDELIINATVLPVSPPVETVATPQENLAQCLDAESQNAAQTHKKIAAIINIAEAACEKNLGFKDNDLSHYYAKKALGLK